MRLLYGNGSITSTQYQNYLRGDNTEAIVKAALTIGGIILLGYLLSKMAE